MSNKGSHERPPGGPVGAPGPRQDICPYYSKNI